MSDKQHFIWADWPAPSHITAFTTTRFGGVSQAPYHQLNLASHVGDDLDKVRKNRQILTKLAQFPSECRWLNQTHSTRVIDAEQWHSDIEADAIYSHQPGQVCCVLTADCLPILLCDKVGQQIAAIHAGWRGLLNGIIENTVAQFQGDKGDILAWLGPAIGPKQFEVGEDVFTAFTNVTEQAQSAFTQTDESHYIANIYELAKQRLNSLGITQVYGGVHCTVSEPENFYSYRREQQTGRMASIIWIADK